MRYLFLVAVAFTLCPPVAAQNFEMGTKAYQSNDYETALREWRPLAKQGSTNAQFAIAHMYRFGIGVPQDDAEAFAWYRRAGEGGHAKAQVILGFLYDYGVGTKADASQAYYWFSLASARDDPVAKANRDKIALTLNADQRTELDRLVKMQLRQAKVPTRNATATPATTLPEETPRTYRVQLGAFENAENAQNFWQILRTEQSDLLNGLELKILSADNGERTLHLLQIGPLNDAKAAKALCADFITRDFECLVVTR